MRPSTGATPTAHLPHAHHVVGDIALGRALVLAPILICCLRVPFSMSRTRTPGAGKPRGSAIPRSRFHNALSKQRPFRLTAQCAGSHPAKEDRSPDTEENAPVPPSAGSFDVRIESAGLVSYHWLLKQGRLRIAWRRRTPSTWDGRRGVQPGISAFGAAWTASMAVAEQQELGDRHGSMNREALRLVALQLLAQLHEHRPSTFMPTSVPSSAPSLPRIRPSWIARRWAVPVARGACRTHASSAPASHAGTTA